MHSSLAAIHAQRIADSSQCSTSYTVPSSRDTGTVFNSRIAQPRGMWRRSALTLRRAGGILERHLSLLEQPNSKI